MRAVALIGDPVRHSISPAMHRVAFAVEGLDFDYRTVRVVREELPWALPRLRAEYAGLNVTIPLKEAIGPLLDEVAPEAERAGSVNTVTFDGVRAVGYSTDGAGFMAALERAGTEEVGRALILGTGGVARAVAAALGERGARVSVSGRTEAAGRRLEADGLATFVAPKGTAVVEALAGADLLVNATPVGAWPDEETSPLPGDVPLDPSLTVFDLVYRPRRTALLRRAGEAGCRTIEGVEMLVEQGRRSFELWTGRRAPGEVMREAAYHALARLPVEAGEGGAGTMAGGGRC